MCDIYRAQYLEYTRAWYHFTKALNSET